MLMAHNPLRRQRSGRQMYVEELFPKLDLIFGIPGQSTSEWEDDLEQALALEPTHVSCYSLMYEPGTPLTGRLLVPINIMASFGEIPSS